jgi:hypothetical protein
MSGGEVVACAKNTAFLVEAAIFTLNLGQMARAML